MRDMPIKYELGELFSSKDRRFKKYVITSIDNPTIKKFIDNNFKVAEQERQLSYFGLSGAGLTDIVNWQKFIKRGVSVEKYKNIYNHQIRSFFAENISKTLQCPEGIEIIESDIDNLLDLEREESLGKNLRFNSFMPFSLINLDYYGGIIATTKQGTMNRVKRLKNLFELQWNNKNTIKYLLLLTVYHGGDDREPETGDSQLLDKIKEHKKGYSDIFKNIIIINRAFFISH